MNFNSVVYLEVTAVPLLKENLSCVFITQCFEAKVAIDIVTGTNIVVCYYVMNNSKNVY